MASSIEQKLTPDEIAHSNPIQFAYFLVGLAVDFEGSRETCEHYEAEAHAALSVLIPAARSANQLNDLAELRQLLRLSPETVVDLIDYTPSGDTLRALLQWIGQFKYVHEDGYNAVNYPAMHAAIDPVFFLILRQLP